MKTAARKSRSAKLPSSRTLFIDAWAEFRRQWKPYVKILALVAIPFDLLSLVALFANDPTTQSYVSFAAIVMNVALLWAVVRRRQTNIMPSVAASYYDGSIALVRYILVSFALVIMLIPAAFGAALYATSLLAADASGIFGVEQILVGLVALLLALPSLYLLTRYALGAFAVVADGLRPMAALRRSRLYTLGRFWPVAGRLVMLAVFLALISLPATLLAFILSLFKTGNLPTVVFEIASTLVALPLADIYLLNLYEALAGTTRPEKTAAKSDELTDQAHDDASAPAAKSADKPNPVV